MKKEAQRDSTSKTNLSSIYQKHKVKFVVIILTIGSITILSKASLLGVHIKNQIDKLLHVHTSVTVHYNNSYTPSRNTPLLSDKDFNKFAIDFLDNASKGNPEAQYGLYRCYLDGRGVEVNEAEAVRWLLLSADNGYSAAQIDLGYSYLYGELVTKNPKKGSEYFEKAAEQGSPRAYYNLGICYKLGVGKEKDLAKAIESFKKAAKLGDVHAHYQMGCMYSDKESSVYSPSLAFESFILGASKLHPGAEYELGCCYLNGMGIAKNSSEAFRWISRAARHDYGTAQGHLALCYLDGIGTEKDYDKAFQYAERAANDASALGHFALAICYENGYGVTANLEMAKKHFELSAINGHAGAQERLSHFYNEQNLEKESISALYWLTKASEGGRADADAMVSAMLLRPLPDRKREQLADKLDTMSKTSVSAQYLMGVCYENGWGMKKNEEKAFGYYLKAAKSGHYGAIFKLVLVYGRGTSFCKKNVGIALNWLKKLPEDDISPDLLLNIGSLYGDGMIVSKDEQKCFKLVHKAAQKGCIDALSTLGFLYLNGIGCKPNGKEAFKCFTEAVNHGIVEAERGIGLCYLNGTGTSVNYQKARNYFESAIKKNNANACVTLGHMYYVGLGLPRDVNKAKTLFEKAAEAGNSDGAYNLGVIYISSNNDCANIDLAIKFFQEAANKGNRKANTGLIRAYVMRYQQKNNETDAKMAMQLCEKAIQHRQPAAEELYLIGYCYHEGIGAKKNKKLAKEYLNAAAKMNHKDAKKLLDDMESFF